MSSPRSREKIAPMKTITGRSYQWNPTWQTEYAVQHNGPFTHDNRFSEDFNNAPPPFQEETPLDLLRSQWDPRPTYTYRNLPTRWYWGAEKAYVPVQSYPVARPLILEQNYVNQTLSNLNPTKPVVDIPLFLWELKDIPRATRDLIRIYKGGWKPSDVFGQHLAVEFGWRPLLSDLISLLSVADKVTQKVDRINNGLMGKSVHQSLGTITTQASTGWAYYLRDQWFAFYTKPTSRWTRRAWASVKMTASSIDESHGLSNGRRLPNRDKLLQFANTGYGLDQGDLPRHVVTLWNMMPWSWLIDYFTNVSTYLGAVSGHMPYNVTSICIMVHDKMEMTVDMKVDPSRPDYGLEFTNHGGRLVRDYKTRRVVSSPTAHIAWNLNPLLDDLSVLSSLATLGLFFRGDVVVAR